MTLHVHPLEAIWTATNVLALLVKVWLLREAIRDHRAVKLLNGAAREIATRGDIRRESIRIGVTLLLLSIVVPGLFIDRDITLTPAILALMAVPLVLLLQSALDLRERRLLTALIAKETRR